MIHNNTCDSKSSAQSFATNYYLGRTYIELSNVIRMTASIWAPGFSLDTSGLFLYVNEKNRIRVKILHLFDLSRQ